MKKILLLVLAVVLLYAATNHKFLLAMAYLYDSDINNDAKAVKLLKDATHNDRDRKSAFLLGYYYKTKKFKILNSKESHNYYLIAANMGDKEAKMLVAWNFYKGIGCIRSHKRAKELLTELAISGNDKAKEILKFVVRN
ncbi:MAG: sel1 repeat family protein [Sulfurovum sp.]|nr:sel1 repeat family protein [Sulfurovum sp.]